MMTAENVVRISGRESVVSSIAKVTAEVSVEGLGSDRMTCEVDADLIQQVVYNLVENAVKFINDRGTLTFRFEKLDGMVTIADISILINILLGIN